MIRRGKIVIFTGAALFSLSPLCDAMPVFVQPASVNFLERRIELPDDLKGCPQLKKGYLLFTEKTQFWKVEENLSRKIRVDSSAMVAAKEISFECPANVTKPNEGPLTVKVEAISITQTTDGPEPFLRLPACIGGFPLDDLIKKLNNDDENPFLAVEGVPDFIQGSQQFKLKDLIFSTGHCRVKPDERAVECEYTSSRALTNILAGLIIKLTPTMQLKRDPHSETYVVRGTRLVVMISYGEVVTSLKVQVRREQ